MNRTISVLLTCHNRKDKTIACLSSLFTQTLSEIDLKVWIVDDGSQDGTADAIRLQFPQVTVISGTGKLYWTGGMRLCWLHALEKPADFYLWLNDDVMLHGNALMRLLACYDSLDKCAPKVGAVIGSMQDPSTKQPTYGGRLAKSRILPMSTSNILIPRDEAISCDYVNGNFCLIPQVAVDAIGIFSEKFSHKMGDFDYSFRLSRAGFKMYVAPGFYGDCSAHPVTGSIKDPQIPLNIRQKMLANPAIYPPLTEWLYFLRKYGGPFWPLLCLKAIVGRLMPTLWLIFNQYKH